MANTPALVTPEWLHEALLATSAQQQSWMSMEPPPRYSDNPMEQLHYHPVKVLDVSWKFDPGYDAYRENFLRGHIPGAKFFDLQLLNESNSKSDSCPTEDCPIPEIETFVRVMSSMGVTSDTHVVLYDSLNNRGPVRAWYVIRLFGHNRVSILNGGLQNWKDHGLEVCCGDAVSSNIRPEEGRPSYEMLGCAHQSRSVGTFKRMFRPELLTDFYEMKAVVENHTAQILDARPEKGAFYLNDDSDAPQPPAGSSVASTEPNSKNDAKPTIVPGHMPGAINIPFSSLFTDKGLFKQESHLANVFNSAGVDLNSPTIATCQRGVSSCGLALVAYILGHKDMPVYNGSWSQWEKLAPTSLIIRNKKQ